MMYVACGYVDEPFGPAFTQGDVWTKHGQPKVVHPLTTLERLSPTDPQVYHHQCVMCEDIFILEK